MHGAEADQVRQQRDDQQAADDGCPADHMAGALLKDMGHEHHDDNCQDDGQDPVDVPGEHLRVGLHIHGTDAHALEDRGHKVD